ncbi:TonB-dependent receptor [candidate division WOR-3 bacterium]|nr:TonB-dependent receptor [candidate division WOR-3 bacterium]
MMFVIAIEGYPAENHGRRAPGGLIGGVVIDAKLEFPLEYVNIVLYDKATKDQITGVVTDKNGNFRLKGIKPGVYTMRVKFIGYYAKTIDPIEITLDKKYIDLGTITLKQAVLVLDGVEVVDEKPAIEFKIDKKVINVSKHYTAVSGTAVDVLENVPSVTVDIEGNVSLRGSGSFTVLINGRPTALESNEALQQIPASTIENIEIITNPSAKYDPEGISGIINIITKKRELQGVNGIVNLNGGMNESYGGDFLLNYRRSNYNAYFGADYNKRIFPGEYQTENQTFSHDTTSFIYSSGDSRFRRTGYGLRGGINLNISAKDIINLGARYGGRAMERTSELNYDEWTDPGDTHNLYISESIWERGGNFYSTNMDYRHTFSKKDHEISGQVILSKRSGDEESTNELSNMDSTITSGQKSTEDGPSKYLRLKLDYTLPLRENNRFETGYQSGIRRTENISKMYDYNPVSGEYEFRPEYSHTSEYNRDIHSLYTIYSGELGRFGYKGGMRGEYTYRLIELMGEDESFSIDRWDYFPTSHVSYQFSSGHQMMASYTRRIRRPRGWSLEPFETWSDAFNVRKGNPNLKPEYIDSYELGYQKRFDKNSFSLEAYHRVTHNKIERVRTVYDVNILLHTFENVGTDYIFGTEFMLNIDLFKLWNLNLMGNLYDYRIKGELHGESFSEESFNWSARLNNTFKFGNSTRIQINSFYYSPSVSSQGEREGFFTTSAAIKQNIFSKNLSATVQVRDVFGTSKYEYTSKGTGFYSHRLSSHKTPILMLTISYNFNNYKPERKRDRDEEEFEGEEEF